MPRNYVVSKKDAALRAGWYDNGTRNPGPFLRYGDGPKHPTSLKTMQNIATRNMKVTLPKIPESRILTDEELK
jgi:hypothetical protein